MHKSKRKKFEKILRGHINTKRSINKASSDKRIEMQLAEYFKVGGELYDYRTIYETILHKSFRH